MGYGNEPNDEFIEYVLSALNIFQEGGKDTRDKLSINWVQHFFDAMPGGFFIYRANEEEEIIYANRELLRIFGCDTMEEFRQHTGNSFKGIVHPEDLDEVEKSIWEQIVENQYDLDYVEYRIIQKNGEVRWIDDYGHFVRNKNVGDFFYVFVGDATEKKRRQMEALHYINKERGQYLELIEGLSSHYESLLYVDLEDDSIRAYRLSSRMKKLFHTELEVHNYSWYVGAYVDAWVHPEDRQLILRVSDPAYIRKKLATSKTYYTNYRVINGEELQYLQLRIVNVGSRDRISQVVMGYRKVDEEVQREMEQKQLYEEALNTANIAINAKNTFLSNMSHDMRTPLNAIFGYTTLARKHMADSQAVLDYLRKIDIASRQLLELIEKVLEISWSESNDTRITETECNLSDIVQDIHENLLPQAEEKNITFSVDSAGMTHCDIFGDQDKLRQLLTNLAANALTYTEYDGTVELIAEELEKFPNNFAVYQFVVKDNGIGISEDFLQRIYEPFEREKNTTFSGIHGSGLGLTIVKSIVDMMGGTIQIDSSPGKGSTFTVILRLRLQTHPLSCVNHTEDVFSSLLNKKILLVDDNMANLEIETEILQGMGFIVETAINGQAAVEKIKLASPEDFDLILMDIQMPVMNGWEAARAIRRLPEPSISHIPIIALSADAFDSDKQMSKESGMDAHLTKPIDIPLILETIARILQSRKGAV